MLVWPMKVALTTAGHTQRLGVAIFVADFARGLVWLATICRQRTRFASQISLL